MVNLDIDKNAVYVLAGNTGADSMALSHMLLEQEAKFVMCFVNYHIGPEWNDNEATLRKYCEEKGIQFEALDADQVNQTGKDANFEKWARKVRYDFFAEVYKKYDAAALFLPHTEDDVIEGYLLAKQTGVRDSKFGLNTVGTTRGMIVRRPLVPYSEADLKEYCDLNNVPYNRDFGNYAHDPSRSAIRREVVDKLNEAERDLYITEIKKAKDELITFSANIKKSVDRVDTLNIREIIALSEGEFADTIIRFVKAKAKIRIRISPQTLAEFRKMCLDPQPNMCMKIGTNTFLVKEYDEISIDNDGLDLPYHYTLQEPCKFSCETFELDFTQGAEDRGIHLDDYPLTIRSVLPQDVWLYNGYAVNAKRMLIAAGISERLLHVWPVFLNKHGKIVYIPRYKKGFSEYHSSSMIIHVNEEEK
ncbi:MAG: tRNA lysidine(34) synthetase TilS [Bacilli bacterium]|nr:tRNA lysidine(34) synthetase TilS [Bacilli bacterium]